MKKSEIWKLLQWFITALFIPAIIAAYYFGVSDQKKTDTDNSQNSQIQEIQNEVKEVKSDVKDMSGEVKDMTIQMKYIVKILEKQEQRQQRIAREKNKIDRNIKINKIEKMPELLKLLAVRE